MALADSVEPRGRGQDLGRNAAFVGEIAPGRRAWAQRRPGRPALADGPVIPLPFRSRDAVGKLGAMPTRWRNSCRTCPKLRLG